MQRMILAAAGLVVLASAVLLTGPAVDSSPARAERREARAGISPGDSSADGNFRAGKHRAERPLETRDRLREQARRVVSMPPDTLRENAIRDLATEWTKIAPTEAEQWARELQDPADRERAFTRICFETAEKKPREAIDIARRNELPEGIVEALVSRWAGKDFEAVASWTGDLPQGETRDRLWMRLAQWRAGETPAEAAAMLSERTVPDGMREEAAIAILHQWLLKDPGAARQWVDSFPDGPLKERATGEVEGVAARRESTGGY